MAKKDSIDLRDLIKRTYRFLFTLTVLPVWLVFLCVSFTRKNGKNYFFSDFSQLFSLLPGRIGDRLRYAFYKLTLRSLGDQTRIMFGATFTEPETWIGTMICIAPFCNIGLCTIEDGVSFGNGVHVLSGLKMHKFDDPTKSIFEQPGGKKERITIGRNCWIGNNAIIGANLGEGCIIGTGSVVVREVPSFSIAAGNPARVIRSRV